MADNGKITRKLPIRKCTACGEHFAKNELIRVLRTPEGEVCIDLVGKKSGRGAYICKRPECFKKARRQKRLDASLECRIPEEIYDILEGEIVGGK